MKDSEDVIQLASEDTILVSIQEYRAILNDKDSSDEQIKKRLSYLEAFCVNIIDLEINKFLKK